MTTSTATTSEQVREPELTAQDLEQVIGGWSVSALSQMGGGGGSEKGHSSFSFTRYLDAASP
jgi:hypothetical protein